MSFLAPSGGGFKAPVPEKAPPAPQPADTELGAKVTERERRRRAGKTSTLLSRGMLTENPTTYMPQMKALLGQ